MKQIYILVLLAILGLKCLSAQSNNFLNFDGSDDVVSSTLPTVFTDIPNNDLSIELWVYPDTLTFSRLLFAQLDEMNFVSVSLNSDGSIVFYVSNEADEKTVEKINANQWSHLALTWNHETEEIQIFMNGILANYVFESNLSSTGDDNIMTIGARTDGVQFYNGSIDELRIWNTIRTQAEIVANMEDELMLPQANLISYYRYNEGVGGADNTGVITANDELDANNGTLSNFQLIGLSSNWLNSSVVTAFDLTNLDSSVKLFPNPSVDFIEITGLSFSRKYKICNMYGAELSSGTTVANERIDIQNLEVGTYFLQLETGLTLKFVKN